MRAASCIALACLSSLMKTSTAMLENLAPFIKHSSLLLFAYVHLNLFGSLDALSKQRPVSLGIIHTTCLGIPVAPLK